MTNNEHNEKVLAQIVEHQEAIEALKETLKPADAVAEVSLEQCNAGAREAHFAKYAEKELIKNTVVNIVNTVVGGGDESAIAKAIKTRKPSKGEAV